MSELDLKLMKHPEPILRKKAEIVLPEEMELMKTVSAQMLQIMRSNNGIGLAGPQANISKRIVVMSIAQKTIIMINPEIIDQQGSSSIEEGCLSVNRIRHYVQRSATVKVRYLNLEAEEVILDAAGLLAICIQHEIDHLDGILFIDRKVPSVLDQLKLKFQELWS